MSDGYGQLCPECGDPYIGGPGCYAGACAAEPEDDDGSRPVTAPNPTDVELVADALARRHCWDGLAEVAEVAPANAESFRYDAEAVLAALAGAGRLVPPDATTRVEWGTRLAAQDGFDEEFSHSFEGAGSTEEERARQRAEVWSRRFGAEHVDVMRRTILVGPWVPVPTTPTEV